MEQLDKRGIHMSDAGGIVKVSADASGMQQKWIIVLSNGACCVDDLA